MSKVNFKNEPPTQPKQAFAPGDWVKCKTTAAFGVVQNANADKIVIKWSGGQTTTEKAENVTESAPTMYLQAIRSFAAKELGYDEEQLQELLTECGLDTGAALDSLEALSNLELTILGRCNPSLDGDGDGWESIEQAAAITETEADIFAAFGVQQPEEAPKPSRVTAGEDPDHPGEFAVFIDGDTQEQFFATLELAQEAIPDWEELLTEKGESLTEKPAEPESQPTNPKKVCGICEQVGVNISSPLLSDGTKVCKKCHLEASKLPAPAPANAASAESICGQTSQQEATEAGADAEAEQSTCESASGSAAAEAIRTDAGLIDPETGELLQESLIMRKFGWTEMPALPDKPSKAELDAYEDKIDQVLDRCLASREQAARWRAACEERCNPLDAAADFWDDMFIKPMARLLGKHRMPKKGKTLHLSSGSVRYTQAGGAFVHDADAVRAHIADHGWENFGSIEARLVVSYDYNKLLSALNKGVLKDIPGTGIKPKDPLSKISTLSPKQGKDEPQQEQENV